VKLPYMTDFPVLYGMRLVKMSRLYRNAAEHVKLTFESDQGARMSVSITASRGSDIWTKFRNEKPR
jgi:hypothetical protein